jgi:TfoX/Sxy family transcriptional regulator of competence genes
MASRADTVQYVVDQLAAAGGITSRKMFGEYALYRDGKVIGFICDDQLYLKPTEAGARLLEEHLQLASPWVGARKHFLITDQLEQRDLLCRLVQVTAQALPLPKPKPSKTPKSLSAARKATGKSTKR